MNNYKWRDLLFSDLVSTSVASYSLSSNPFTVHKKISARCKDLIKRGVMQFLLGICYVYVVLTVIFTCDALLPMITCAEPVIVS